MSTDRIRARAAGIRPGLLPTGKTNSITDVAGVQVGHTTLSRDPDENGRVMRTGVTAVWPHAGVPWREPVYAGTAVLNGWGELIGITALNEWGILESPIILTSSLYIGAAYEAAVRWIARTYPDVDDVTMPVVTECSDDYLNDTIAFPLPPDAVDHALESATTGPPAEGCVGAGTGMVCFEFKGGIGTASRVVTVDGETYTVGALTLTNFGFRSELRIDGVPVGREIADLMPPDEKGEEGSCIVLVATDAPMLPHQLRRLARRAGLGLARCGSFAGNTSGEIFLAFSTAQTLPYDQPRSAIRINALADGARPIDSFNPLFRGAVEAVEEAVINSLFATTTTVGRKGRIVHALPIDRVLELFEKYGRRVR
ncbi:MAG TPA: P1 family peptidase [Candidatus Dormibacteraeota bacterium]|nr:P1 family peptidase [Candidatus Dormibacteraeota bacterium]